MATESMGAATHRALVIFYTSRLTRRNCNLFAFERCNFIRMNALNVVERESIFFFCIDASIEYFPVSSTLFRVPKSSVLRKAYSLASIRLQKTTMLDAKSMEINIYISPKITQLLPNMHSSSNIVCKYWIIVPKAKGRIFRLPTKNETLVELHNNNIIWIEKTKILPQTSTFQIKFINYYNVHSTCVYVYKPWFNPSTHRYFFFLAVFF